MKYFKKKKLILILGKSGKLKIINAHDKKILLSFNTNMDQDGNINLKASTSLLIKNTLFILAEISSYKTSYYYRVEITQRNLYKYPLGYRSTTMNLIEIDHNFESMEGKGNYFSLAENGRLFLNLVDSEGEVRMVDTHDLKSDAPIVNEYSRVFCMNLTKMFDFEKDIYVFMHFYGLSDDINKSLYYEIHGVLNY